MDAEFNRRKWFSREFDTLEYARWDVGHLGFFPQYGIFQTTEGKFVHANLRLRQWTDEEVKTVHDEMLQLTGYRLVEWSTALFGWKEYIE